MIQRCPECGEWCEAGKDGLLNRASRGLVEGMDGTINVGEKIGGIFGNKGKKLGSTLAAVGSGYVGLLNAAAESLLGDDYHFVCPNCGKEWSTDDPEDDQTEEYYESQKKYIKQFRIKYHSIINSTLQEKQEFVKELQHQLSDESNTEAQNATLYAFIAASYQLIGDRNNALMAVNDSLKLFDDVNTRVLKGIIMGQGRNAQDTYSAMQEVIHYKFPERAESPFLSTPQIEEEFSKLQTSFSQNFLSIPLQQRKYLVFCDEVIKLPQNIRVLPMSEIPTDIKFLPEDHYPVSNTLYVCHPYRADYYIPYESYEVEILRDELEEFIRIMTNLGAKHIDYSDHFENGEESSAQKKRDIHGGGDYEGQYSANGIYESEENNNIIRKLSNTIEGSRDFLLAEKPTLPPDLVWYDHRKAWQHKCEERLAGRFIHDVFIISTSSSEITTESERKKFEADLKMLLVSAEGGTEGTTSYMQKKEKEITWKVNVEFYPMFDYEKKEVVVMEPHVNKAQPVKELMQHKKLNMTWLMGAVILILVAIIIGLLIF